ncbi:MAG: putative RDD family membrane protein YckC [Paraglaciecola sp.]|jgi:uncharacterized RDD family membrane protein YckC
MLKATNEVSIPEQEMPRSEAVEYPLPVKFPALYQRYFAALLDTALIFASAYFISTFIPFFENTSFEQFIAVLLLLFTYDAFFTAKFCTLGQLLLKFRVRNRAGRNKITFSTALLRSAIKILFGGYSLIAMIFNRERRALHDFVSNTLVIFPDDGKRHK